VLERDDGIEAVVAAVQLDHYEDRVFCARLMAGSGEGGGTADEQGRIQPQGHQARVLEEIASRLTHGRSFSALTGERGVNCPLARRQSSWNSGCVNTRWHRVRTRLS